MAGAELSVRCEEDLQVPGRSAAASPLAAAVAEIQGQRGLSPGRLLSHERPRSGA